MRKSTGVSIVVGLVAASLAGCQHADSHEPAPSPTSRVSVSDPNVVVLRAIRTGGDFGVRSAGEVPDFSLYADRLFITHDEDGVPLSVRLEPAEFDNLISAADAAGLGKPRRLAKPSGEPAIPDATDLSFVFAPDGKARDTFVQGIEYEGTDRDRLADLYDELLDNAPSDDETYETDRVTLLSEQLIPPEEDPGIPWPLRVQPVRPSSYRPTCQRLDPKDTETLTDLLAGNPEALLWAHRIGQFQVRMRPLLPDERGCEDLFDVEPV
ncbi:hypothetical protein [Flindersiella endophytica]